MYPHHEQSIANLVNMFKDDARFLAIIVGGSIARKRELVNSDIDVFLVVSDTEWADCRRNHRYSAIIRKPCVYEGGYVDAKIVDMSFIQDVADHGSEPARDAFMGAFTAFSHVSELDGLLKRIPVYPEADRQERMQAFYAQVEALRYFVRQAEKRGDPYLMARVVSDLVLYVGRMILTYNRILFPGHKWFLEEVEQAPQQPVGLMEHIRALLAAPSREQVEKLCECLYGFTEWDRPPQGWVARFLEDSEWNWQTGRISPAEW